MQDAYIQERSDAMENIHSTIVELGTIFRQLAEMVQQQEEQVARWVRETLPLLLIDGRLLSEIISMVSPVMLTNDDWWAVFVVS